MSETVTMTLTEFLLARIDDDEAEHMAHLMDGESDAGLEAALRETAHWKAVELNLAVRRVGAHLPFFRRALAMPYQHHPDYRAEWRLLK